MFSHDIPLFHKLVDERPRVSIHLNEKYLQSTNFNPKTSTRIECIIILLIFTATAVLGQQASSKEVTLVNPSSMETKKQ